MLQKSTDSVGGVTGVLFLRLPLAVQSGIVPSPEYEGRPELGSSGRDSPAPEEQVPSWGIFSFKAAAILGKGRGMGTGNHTHRTKRRDNVPASRRFSV